MRGAAAFVEILDEKLADVSVETARPAAATTAYRPAPVIGFFHFAPATDAEPFRLQAHGWRQADLRQTRPFVRPVTRPRRALTTAQQRALDVLVDLGAPLTAEFTADELRSAFRALARRFHPDRHPGKSDAEKRQLATVFSRLHTAYTALQIVPAAA